MLELFYSTGIRRTSFAAWTCPTEHRTPDAPRPFGQGPKDRVVPWASGRCFGWSVTCGKSARGCAWTRARKPCSDRLRRGVQSRRGVAHGCGLGQADGLTRPAPATCCATPAPPTCWSTGGCPLHPAVAGSRVVGHHGHFTEVSIKDSKKFTPAAIHPQNSRKKNRLPFRRKRVALPRGCRRTKLLHFFSCWPGVSPRQPATFRPSWATGHTHFCPTLTHRQNSCRGFAPLRIGSASTASAFSFNKHAGLPALSLQNRVGSAQVPKSRPDWVQRRNELLRLRQRKPVSYWIRLD